MTPVQKVQQWLTAIGETEYDAAHRERLLWEELRELQAATDDWNPPYTEFAEATRRKHLIAIVRETCDVAIVAIGNALLRGHGTDRVHFDPSFRAKELDGAMVEEQMYGLFRRPGRLQCVVDAAAYYGFGDKLEACFAEVHRANMRKLYCTTCDDIGCHIRYSCEGKIVKPAGWEAPNLGPILFGGEK